MSSRYGHGAGESLDECKRADSAVCRSTRNEAAAWWSVSISSGHQEQVTNHSIVRPARPTHRSFCGTRQPFISQTDSRTPTNNNQGDTIKPAYLTNNHHRPHCPTATVEPAYPHQQPPSPPLLYRHCRARLPPTNNHHAPTALPPL